MPGVPQKGEEGRWVRLAVAGVHLLCGGLSLRGRWVAAGAQEGGRAGTRAPLATGGTQTPFSSFNSELSFAVSALKLGVHAEVFA